MHADLRQIDYTSIPGSTFDVVVEVRNTGSVIDGARARVLGLDRSWVSGEPDYIALFPDASDELRLRVRLPESFPAGDHSLQIEVASDVDPSQSQTLHATLHVIELAEPGLTIVPQTVTSRRDATFTVSCNNHGNATTTMELVAFDVEQELDLRLRPAVVELPPGTTSNVVLDARRRRCLVGGRTTYPVTVRATTPSHQIETRATYIQRPVISPGVLTAGILALIVALWAAAFLFGIDRILGREDELAKTAPASFYEPAASGAGVIGNTDGIGAVGAADAASKGLDITAVGGTVSGVVDGPDGAGIPGLTVTAMRRSGGAGVAASAAATDADGAYAVGPLVPGDYVLQVSGPGFRTIYVPGVATAAEATPVTVTTKADTQAPAVTVNGEPGSITGTVVTGPGPATGVGVVLRQVIAGVEQAGDLDRMVSGADGSFSFTGLTTPATYEVTVAPDSTTYATTKTRVALTGGEDLVINTVVATGAQGTVSGLVSDAEGSPLGGVDITASSGDVTIATSTPTVGQVGSYTLVGIPAPGTYLLSFTLDGVGKETVVVDLGPGEDRYLDVTIRGGTVTLAGSVAGRDGPGERPAAIEGAQIRVQGGAVDVTTTTNSNGDFLVPGLKAGSRLAVTLSADGYVTTTQTVVAGTDDSVLDVTLDRALRTVIGRGVRSGAGLPGAKVVLTDGVTTRTAQTASNPAGEFRFTDVPFGSYSLTVTASDGATSTTMVEISEGTDAVADLGDLEVPPPSGAA